MNQFQLMSVCARNDFLVIQASQTRRAAERQLGKQTDGCTDVRGGGDDGMDEQTDRHTAHTFGEAGRIEMKRNQDERSLGAVEGSRAQAEGRGSGQTETAQRVRSAIRSFIRHSFSFLAQRFSCLVLCFALLRFAFLFTAPRVRIEVCVARKSKES